ncbi:MAG: MBL fold metallo-hydrolase [Methanomassiliicoccales archaeon]|nr:MAG: MBL fold metallo-hydrolase [Methanomassiliicoccales archaeon]
MMISVIKPGFLVRNSLGMILRASSTVTLVRDDKRNIIVDSGIPGERDKILKGLSKHGLSQDDIDIVINTHLHQDHMGNNALFRKAKFLAHAKEFPPRLKEVHVIEGDFELSTNIKIIETPCHTYGSISVVVDSPEKSRVYVIAGDALPIKDNYIKWVPPGINFNPQIALSSMKKIVDIADVIIPGHDDLFEVESG